MELRVNGGAWLAGKACAIAFGLFAAGFGSAPATAFESGKLAEEKLPPLVLEIQGRDRDRYEDRFSDREGEWELLGTTKGGQLPEREIIEVGRREGRYDRLVLEVRGNDVEIIRMIVVYGNNEREELAFRERLREGSRTRPIQLGGRGGRFIQQIEIFFRAAPNFQGRTKLAVYGRKAQAERNPEDVEGKRANCDTYAALAVVQAEANEKYRCNIRGPEWSTDKRGHFRWCLFNKREFMLDELRYRATELQKCFDKLGDFDDERYDRNYRRRRF